MLTYQSAFAGPYNSVSKVRCIAALGIISNYILARFLLLWVSWINYRGSESDWITEQQVDMRTRVSDAAVTGSSINTVMFAHRPTSVNNKQLVSVSRRTAS